MEIYVVEVAGLFLYLIGFFGLMAHRNIVKTILSLGTMDIGVIVFFLGIRYTPGAVPPIGDTAGKAVADPIPQAMMITAIIIGVAVTAVALMMFIVKYHRYGTTNWHTAFKIRQEENED